MGCGITNSSKSHHYRTQSSSISLQNFIKASSEDQKGKFQLIKKIGSGTFSTVFLCSKKSTNQKCALKVIQKDTLSTEMLDDVLKVKEAAILRDLDHPNIVKCFEIFEDRSHVIISEEFIQGGTLLDFYKSNMGFTKIANILSQVLSALVYCHDRGIVHRDIKLENVFIVDSAGVQIKIGDFGFATVKKTGEQIRGCCGTLSYMAPEVFTDSYDEKVDVWACGVLLYMLVTGKYPYLPAASHVLKEQIKNFPLSVKRKEIQALPKDLSSYLEGFLVIDPNQRFSAKEALNHSWLKKHKEQDKDTHKEFIHKFLNLSRKTLLQKSVCIYINTFYSDSKEVGEFYKYFKMVDTDGNGTIDKRELGQELMRMVDEQKSMKIVEEFFEDFDLNNNGVIDYTEFVAAICEDSVLNERNVEKVFKEMGKGKGFVTVAEIGRFFGLDLSFSIDFKKKYKINQKIGVEEFKKLTKCTKVN